MTAAQSNPHSPHMTPEQAAQAAGVSRWTILRAIKNQRLQARRDNRNRWQITREALRDWSAHTVRTVCEPEAEPPPAQQDEAPAMRAALAAETARADAAERARDQAETERDQWRDMAQILARRGWKWPWQR
jgi:excisionase family DNA binding protein